VYLDPGLAEALRDTDLPSDLSISDIGFSWPSVRLMVPRDLCLSSDGRSGQIQYVDVAFCGQDEVINLSEELVSDLKNGLAKLRSNRALDDRLTKGFIHREAGQFYACALSYRRSGNLSAPDSAASYQTAAWSIQWETRLLQEVIQAGNKADRDHGKDPGVPDLGQIRSLVFNTLIVLSSYRSPLILEEPAIVRNLKLEGSHLRPELVRGRFLSELLRPRTVRTGKVESWAQIGEHNSSSPESTGEGTGRKYRAHFVRGHHRRVRFGKGLTQSRLTWIAPFRTYGPEQQKASEAEV
jgi:hypothetical protein